MTLFSRCPGCHSHRFFPIILRAGRIYPHIAILGLQIGIHEQFHIVQWSEHRIFHGIVLQHVGLCPAVFLHMRYSTAAGVLLAAAVLFGNVQSTTSYRAYRMWKNGWAQAYGAGWEDRLKVLKDDSVKNPVFTPLNYVELIMYTDLQPEDGYVWVNSACAEYYGKESVTVVEGE